MVDKCLNGVEKAALLVMQLEDETASKVMKSMDVSEITKISRAMSNFGSVSQEISQQVLEEAYNNLNDEENIIGNIGNTKNILTKIFGEEEASEIINNIDPDIWHKLAKLEPEKLVSRKSASYSFGISKIT